MARDGREHAVGARRSRPTDVLTMYGGKTVEVLNTDAEGRLVLADALARASEENPTSSSTSRPSPARQVVALGHPDAGDHG